MGVTFLYRIDDSCVAKHQNDRVSKIREEEERQEEQNF